MAAGYPDTDNNMFVMHEGYFAGEFMISNKTLSYSIGDLLTAELIGCRTHMGYAQLMFNDKQAPIFSYKLLIHESRHVGDLYVEYQTHSTVINTEWRRLVPYDIVNIVLRKRGRRPYMFWMPAVNPSKITNKFTFAVEPDDEEFDPDEFF